MSKTIPSENNARVNRCAIYVRTATAYQADGSVEAQIVCCREFAARRGWELVDEDIYVDSGISGLSKDHPALNELIATASSFRPFVYILVASVDRLSRSLPHYLEMRCKLRGLGIRLLSVEVRIANGPDKHSSEC
jgi:DNA invertase Pin-like site-specific DNA recombinase